MSEKKSLSILIGILFLALILVVGVSYALWQIRLQQSSANVITTGCFKVEFNDANPIHLDKSYPISDEEGKKLTPYSFTITNTCDSYASYQINLEILNSTTLENLGFLKVMLEDKINRLTENDSVAKTLENAKTSYQLETGYLGAKESKTFSLRLWMDENTPTREEFMNKLFESKVTVATSYLKEAPKTVSEQNIEYIKAKASADMLIVDDDTVDHNMRYIGANPSNYVYFNCDDASNPTKETCELWRIIGLMNHIDDGTGTKESRIKLIRNESIGEYSWDTSASTINGGLGVNEWSQADTMKLLNPSYADPESVGDSLYWNRQSGTCYNGENNAITDCDFSASGLKETAKSLIGKAVWNTGALENPRESSSIDAYELERSTNTGKSCTSGIWCNDIVPRTTTWTGYIGLMYPSDYGYATSGGNTDRETCLNSYIYIWVSSYPSCAQNNWLKPLTGCFWSITPSRYFIQPASAGVTYVNGGIGSNDRADMQCQVRPSIYLNSNVKILSGEGTELSPFVLSKVE